jgi:hypothetical protein
MVLVVRHLMPLLVLATSFQLFAIAQELPSGSPLAKARPTAALIDLDRSPVAALLEAELLAGEDAIWVERTEIEKVLDEQKLQAVFSPDAGGERARLGRILKADLLVLVRSGKAENVPYLDLVISEVSRGLRLVNRRVPLSNDAQRDVAELVQLVRDGVKRQGQEIQAIYAVPPFLSDDLLYNYDDLRSAYARLIEQRLLEHPGVLVVELAEAEALARELALGGAEANISRQSPFFLLGQYRNEGSGDARRITIRIALKQGATELGATSQTLKPDDASQFLREKTGNVLARLNGKPPAVDNPELEAEQLAKRSKDFSRLGNWEDALALIQASLLLDPQQPDMHHDAVVASSKLVKRHWQYGNVKLSEAKLAMGYYLRGLDHQMAFYHTGGDLRKYSQSGGGDFTYLLRGASNGLNVHPSSDPELKMFMAEVHQRHHEVWLKRTRELVAQKKDDEAADSLIRCIAIFDAVKQYEIRRQLIQEFQDLPGAKQRTISFSHKGYTIDFLGLPEGKKHLELLAASSSQEVRNAAEAMQKSLAASQQARKLAEANPQPMPTLEPIPAGGLQAHIEPVTFSWFDAAGQSGKLESIDGCLPASAGLDIVWRQGGLYLMREKGRLKRVWDAGGLNVLFSYTSNSGVCFDGHYVWGTVLRYQEQPRLLILDPATEKFWEITAADGLPLVEHEDLVERSNQTICVAAIAPGKICVAGDFGRAWLAIVTFKPETGAKVEVFHEAKEQPNPANRDQWRDTHITFHPTHMFMLETKSADGSSPERRLLIGRHSNHIEVMSHPLVVNPATLQVDVLEDEFWAGHRSLDLCPHEGAVYFVYAARPRYDRIGLLRLGLPGPKVEFIFEVPREGHAIFLNNQLNIAGKQWWVGNLADKAVKPAGPVPWYHPNMLGASGPDPGPPMVNAPRLELLAPSHHYGLLANYTTNDGKWTLAQVSFRKADSPADDSAAK